MKLSLSSANNRVKKNNLFHKNINFGLKKVPNKTVNIEDIKLDIDTKLETITEVSETSSLNSPSINEIIKQSEKSITFYESVSEETQTEEIDEPDNESVAEPVVEKVAEPVVEKVAEPVVEEVAEPVVEPVVEPVIEEVVEPVIEEVAEPVVEPVVEEEKKEVIIEETPKKKRGRKKKSN